MKSGPWWLLKEEDIDIIKDLLCPKCYKNVHGPSSYVNLTCGREG